MSDDKPTSLIHIGRVVGLHGLRGELKIRRTGADKDFFSNISSVTVKRPDGELFSRDVNRASTAGRLVMMQLQGFEDRTAAEALLNAEIFVDKEQVSKPSVNQWWFSDLIGLPVFTTDGRLVGNLAAIIDGATQILEIRDLSQAGAKTILVPFVKALVPLVDVKNQRLEVVDLPGLLEAQ